MPGGAVPIEFNNLGIGTTFSKWLPTGLLIIIGAFVLVWLPIRWREPGLALYAIGSDRNAAYLAGINVARDAHLRVRARRRLHRLRRARADRDDDDRRARSPATITLNSVAAVVLGGVSRSAASAG